MGAYGGSVTAVRLLLDRGADPDSGALHAASAAGRPEVVTVLPAVDVDATTDDGAGPQVGPGAGPVAG